MSCKHNRCFKAGGLSISAAKKLSLEIAHRSKEIKQAPTNPCRLPEPGAGAGEQEQEHRVCDLFQRWESKCFPNSPGRARVWRTPKLGHTQVSKYQPSLKIHLRHSRK